jgi:hypothetical protein
MKSVETGSKRQTQNTSNLEHAVGVAEQEKEFSEKDADERFSEVMISLNSADELVSTVKFRSDVVQMSVVFLATLQWGFGDLLVTSFFDWIANALL